MDPASVQKTAQALLDEFFEDLDDMSGANTDGELLKDLILYMLSPLSIKRTLDITAASLSQARDKMGWDTEMKEDLLD